MAVHRSRPEETRPAVRICCNRFASSAAPAPRCVRTADRVLPPGSRTPRTVPQTNICNAFVHAQRLPALRGSPRSAPGRPRRRSTAARSSTATSRPGASPTRPHARIAGCFPMSLESASYSNVPDTESSQCRGAAAPASSSRAIVAARSWRRRSHALPRVIDRLAAGTSASLAARQASPHRRAEHTPTDAVPTRRSSHPIDCSMNGRRAKFPLGLERSR